MTERIEGIIQPASPPVLSLSTQESVTDAGRV